MRVLLLLFQLRLPLLLLLLQDVLLHLRVLLLLRGGVTQLLYDFIPKQGVVESGLCGGRRGKTGQRVMGRLGQAVGTDQTYHSRPA